MTLPRLRHSIAALGTIQIANYLIPLITLPYLTRTLGLEIFGKFALVQAFSAYLILITDYGFSWSATRKISEHRLDKKIVSDIFVNVWVAQWMLAAAIIIILISFIYLTPTLHENSNYFLMLIPAIIANIITPFWLLQGLERMKEVAIIQVVSRLAALPLLLLFVKSAKDGALALLIISMSSIVAGIISLYWIKQQKLIFTTRPKLASIVLELKNGAGLFMTKIAISLYTTLTPLLLGSIAGSTALGLFNLADKVRNAAQSGMTPVSQALFPRMSHLYKHNDTAARLLLKRSILTVLLLAGGISALLWLLADWIISILGGADFAEAAQVLRWLSLLPLLIGLSNIFGVQVMLPNNLNRPFNRILMCASGLSLLIVWPLVSIKGAVGAAQTFLLCELFVTVTMGTYLLRNGHLKARKQ